VAERFKAAVLKTVNGDSENAGIPVSYAVFF
jgi:hypothetical protein